MEYNNSGAHAGDGEALSTIATLAEHERWMRLALDEGSAQHASVRYLSAR